MTGERQQHAAIAGGAGIGGWLAMLIDRGVRRDRLAGFGGDLDFHQADGAGRHVPDDRLGVPARAGKGDRIGAEQLFGAAMRCHMRARDHTGESHQPGIGERLQVMAQGADIVGVPDRHRGDAGLPGGLDQVRAKPADRHLAIAVVAIDADDARAGPLRRRLADAVHMPAAQAEHVVVHREEAVARWPITLTKQDHIGQYRRDIPGTAIGQEHLMRQGSGRVER